MRFDHEQNRREFEERLAATMAALERWDVAERALAQAGIEMARDVRRIIGEVPSC